MKVGVEPVLQERRPVRPMRSNPRATPLLVVALALTACAARTGASPSEASPSDDGRPTISAPALETVPPSDVPVTGEVPARILDAIVADAAERGSVEPADVEVVQAASVTWSDGSLGCPEPGMNYTMALVDGYHVIVVAGDDELDYRATTQGGFRVCEGGGRPSG
jgi:hypothetical protein